MKKVWLITGIIVIGGGLAVGGYFVWQKISWKAPFPKTRAGMAFEKILPEDATFVLNFYPTDSAERERFKKLLGAVLQDKKDALPLLIVQTFLDSGFSGSPKTDFLQMLDSSYAFTFAIAGNIIQKPPTFYFLLAVDDADKNKLFEVMKRLTADKPALRADLIGDVIRVTNAKKESTVPPKSLANLAVFKKSFRNLEAPFSGYMFISPQSLQFFGQSFAAASSAGFHAKENGLLVSAATIFDKENTGESFYDVALKPYSASLYQFVQGAADARKPIFYAEGQGLGEIFVKSFYYGFANAAQFNKSTGFDFETDVKPVLDDGFAMVLHDTGSLLPAFSFFINAKNAPEKARNIVKELQERDAAFVILGNLALKSGTDSPVIEPRQPFKNMPDAGVIKIYLNRIPKQIAAIPLFEKLAEPLEISYGITNTNLLFFSTLLNFEEALKNGKSIGESTDILQKSRAFLDMEPGSVAHFDFTAFGSYIERLLAFAKEQEKLSPDQEEVYDFFKKHLAPIKEFIQVNQGDGKTLRGKSFLRIAP